MSHLVPHLLPAPHHPSTNTITDASKIYCPGVLSHPLCSHTCPSLYQLQLIFPSTPVISPILFSHCGLNEAFFKQNITSFHSSLIDGLCSSLRYWVVLYDLTFPCPHHLMPLSLPASMLQQHQPPSSSSAILCCSNQGHTLVLPSAQDG